jgi:hypothetical protein
MRPAKRPKPSFDVSRAALDDTSAGWVYRSHEPPLAAAPPVTAKAAGATEPEAPKPSDAPVSGWVAAGVGVLVLPVTLAVVAMMAPVIWLLAPRARR